MPLTQPHNSWTKNSVTIHLSSDRRGKLADYVIGIDGGMTPAEAIYSLIDSASKLLVEESQDDVKAQIAALTIYLKSQDKAILDCSNALKSVTEVLHSIQNNLRDL